MQKAEKRTTRAVTFSYLFALSAGHRLAEHFYLLSHFTLSLMISSNSKLLTRMLDSSVPRKPALILARKVRRYLKHAWNNVSLALI